MTKKRVAVITAAILFIGLQAAEVWQILSLRGRVANAEWNYALLQEAQDDTITADVGTIQFLRRGYSIELQSVKYTGEGLVLSGFVGNPMNLSLSSLTLKFTVTKPLYEYRDEFRKDKFWFVFGLQPIGEAQTSPITYLPPKSKEPFDVTIPNVKQTKDGVRIQVTFTGERYSY